MRRDIELAEIRHALQLDGRAAAVEFDDGIPTDRADFVTLLQLGERVAVDVQLVVSRHEVCDDVLSHVLGQKFQHMLGLTAASDRIARYAARGRILAGAQATLHQRFAGSGNEIVRKTAPQQGGLSA